MAMTECRSSNDQQNGQKTTLLSTGDGGDDSEDESEIIEESPCGRWAKRREEVDQRDVPGIECAYLAMDTEEGVEVVWNEVRFSDRNNLKAQEDKITLVFENLTRLDHPNIVKFHKYWMDTQTDEPRVVFITEYMSSGSLKQFLKKTKRNTKRLPHQTWKRWCTQILSALSYLDSCSPSIILGNLTCDTIFIQHNGLVKIGSVAADAINNDGKSCRDNIKNLHFVAPEYAEYANSTPALNSAVDIYSFGMCALEMAALEIQGNGDSGTEVTEEHINRTIESLEIQEEPSLSDFIRKCLEHDPEKRPTARELLFHPVLSQDLENRRVVNMMCNVKAREEGPGILMTILVRMDDKMNRQLSCVVNPATESADQLSNELVFYGFINEADRDKLTNLIQELLVKETKEITQT